MSEIEPVYSLTRAQLLDMAHEFFHQGQDNEPYTVWEMGSVLDQWLEANAAPQPAPANAVTEAADAALVAKLRGELVKVWQRGRLDGPLIHTAEMQHSEAVAQADYALQRCRLLDAGESEVRE